MVEGPQALGHRTALGANEHAEIARRELGLVLLKIAGFVFAVLYLAILGWVLMRFVAMHRCAGGPQWDQASCDKIIIRPF